MEINCYWPNGNLFDLANTPRDFISRCIQGGRCMTADNQKHSIEGEIVDFDAVSLYPSAIARLYTLEGIPKVLTSEMLSSEYLLNHLFDDEQLVPTDEKFISGFFIEAKIVSVGIPRHFPLVVYDPRWNPVEDHERSTNDPCVMYMDHITFQDLIKFQKCEIVPIRGYYYSDKRDPLCRKVIKDLFNLRLEYKRQGNPLQQIIKLMLNSIYGKTILKPIDTRLVFKKITEKEKYIHNRYHYIKELVGYDNGRKFMSTEYMPYHKHFAFVTFGVNILSMSKRIMNEVMCTGEDLGIELFYQDSDSMHMYSRNLEKLSTEFKKRYNRDLIGKDLGQFHSDLEPVNGDSNVVATRSIFVMKKCYIDQLENSQGEIAFHVRMKGIPTDVIAIRANELYPDAIKCFYRDGLVYPEALGEKYSIIELYKSLYDGEEIEFDLTKGAHPCFDIHIGHTSTKESFTRRVKL